MRFHCVSMPHTETLRDEFSWCAFTTKARRFCDMMTSLGNEVILYAGERNDAAVSELVPVLTRSEQRKYFGAVGDIPEFNTSLPGHKEFTRRAAKELHQRMQPGDFLCLTAGVLHANLARATEVMPDGTPGLMTVEYGCGYAGVFSDFVVFESYAWMHAIYAQFEGAYAANGRFYDGVIPNYYDLSEFPVGDGSGDYLLFIGRLIDRKGLAVVQAITAATGLPLKVAGNGDLSAIPKGAEYLGNLEPKERAEVMGGARCTLVPTLYVGPFEGVNVESQLCGTPVVTTDWGAFVETVRPGVSGYRCRTLDQFVRAVDACGSLDRAAVRKHAERYDMNIIRYKYEAYFQQLQSLWSGGWYKGYEAKMGDIMALRQGMDDNPLQHVEETDAGTGK